MQRSNSQFEIPGVLRFEEGHGGLTHAVISAKDAEAELYLQGAHLTHWQPKDQRPVLFMSPNSLFEQGKAIRGGVPIVFPWFGPRSDGQPGPAHGYARITEWDVEFTKQHDEGTVEIALVLASSETSLRFCVTIGKNLDMTVQARNNRQEPLQFEEALHTYFAVSDIRQVSISGLEGSEYLDKTDRFRRKRAGGSAIHFEEETDQVHVNTGSTCVIDDPVLNRRIVIAKHGSESTVVWNPWREKASAMADLGPDVWTQFVCVESGNIGENGVRLAPGATHEMAVSVRVLGG